MDIYAQVISGLWSILIAWWMISAISAKRNTSAIPAWRVVIRLVVLVVFAALWRFHALNGTVWHFRRGMIFSGAPSDLAGIAGTAVCALGVAIAIWARVCLGRNWGMPMSRKENPELISNGPYAYIRHPIYTGILLALLGSGIAEGGGWLAVCAVAFVYFVYSARNEEKLMLEQFPQQYSEYMKRTQMLVPYIW